MTLKNEYGGNKRWYRVECDASRFRLSAHGGLGDTVEMVKKIVGRRGKNLEMIVLTHGTQDSKRSAMNVLRPLTNSVITGLTGTVISL